MEVLLVSRSERARAWMAGALGMDWEVLEARDGNEALRIAKEEIPEVVIADETTEPYGAFGLARELKNLPAPPAVIVLLDRRIDDWLSKWSGADRWLSQPVDPFALAAAARELAEEIGEGDDDDDEVVTGSDPEVVGARTGSEPESEPN